MNAMPWYLPLKFTITHLLVATGLVGVACFTYIAFRDVLKTEPFKAQPPFHWSEHHGPK